MNRCLEFFYSASLLQMYYICFVSIFISILNLFLSSIGIFILLFTRVGRFLPDFRLRLKSALLTLNLSLNFFLFQNLCHFLTFRFYIFVCSELNRHISFSFLLFLTEDLFRLVRQFDFSCLILLCLLRMLFLLVFFNNSIGISLI